MTLPNKDWLRHELNLLFDDGRIAQAQDKPPHVCEAYITRAEKAIRSRIDGALKPKTGERPHHMSIFDEGYNQAISDVKKSLNLEDRNETNG